MLFTLDKWEIILGISIGYLWFSMSMNDPIKVAAGDIRTSATIPMKNNKKEILLRRGIEIPTTDDPAVQEAEMDELIVKSAYMQLPNVHTAVPGRGNARYAGQILQNRIRLEHSEAFKSLVGPEDNM